MQQRTLGRGGPTVSLVGLGCNNFGARTDLAATTRVVFKALDLGITLFDTADAYGNRGGSEQQLGQILGTRRDEVFLATKFGLPMDDSGDRQGAAPAYIVAALEASLQRLRTDRIDLYQLHKPDPLTPIADTLAALASLVRAGKVRYIGVSNLPVWQLAEAHRIAVQDGLPLIASQNEYSLLARDAELELLPALAAYGLGLLPYFPLASGLLSGKYRRDQPFPPDTRLGATPNRARRYLTERGWNTIEALRQFSAEHGRTLLELAFAWLAAQPTVSSVIAGATRPEQLEQNARAIDWVLSAADIAAVDAIAARA